MFNLKSRRRKIIFGLAVFCLVLIVGGLVWWGVKSFGGRGKILTPEDLLAKVGGLVVLPTDEKPTIATVTDLTELKKQEFFSKAEIGDKVIIYAKAGKAILYSPTSNKIIEMAPLNKSLINK